MDNAITLDGFLDEETTPGDLHGTTARFRISLSPSDEGIDEAVLPCTVSKPELAHAVLHELRRGDQLRVTGYLHLPQAPDDALWLEVRAITVLHPTLLQDADEDETAAWALLADDGLADEQEAMPLIERYADYLVIHDPIGVTYVWHTSGQPVGETEDPATITDLIDAFERRSAHGET